MAAKGAENGAPTPTPPAVPLLTRPGNYRGAGFSSEEEMKGKERGKKKEEQEGKGKEKSRREA